MLKRFSILRAAAFALVAAAGPATAQDFDHYLLSLSWSPSWCAGDADRLDEPQCHPDRDLGFTLHGLWPQYESGDWPEYCRTNQRDPSRAQTGEMADIMGSGGLAWHQWKKHGRCSGLSAEDYFNTARFAWSLLSLPFPDTRLTASELVDRLVEANPDLAPEDLVVTCRGPEIREVRICLTTDLQSRPCSRGVRDDACRHRGDLDFPPPP